MAEDGLLDSGQTTNRTGSRARREAPNVDLSRSHRPRLNAVGKPDRRRRVSLVIGGRGEFAVKDSPHTRSRG